MSTADPAPRSKRLLRLALRRARGALGGSSSVVAPFCSRLTIVPATRRRHFFRVVLTKWAHASAVALGGGGVVRALVAERASWSRRRIATTGRRGSAAGVRAGRCLLSGSRSPRRPP